MAWQRIGAKPLSTITKISDTTWHGRIFICISLKHFSAWKWQLNMATANLGGWFNIKMPSYQYRKSHCGDKTILRPSCLHNGISYTGKMTSLYCFGALAPCVSRTGHPWPWCWLCNLSKYFSSLGKNFNYLHLICAKEWWTMQIYFRTF